MKRLVSTLHLEKSEWLAYRKRGIGGSDAGAVCGLNPYRTAIQVYYDKTNQKRKHRKSVPTDNLLLKDKDEAYHRHRSDSHAIRQA